MTEPTPRDVPPDDEPAIIFDSLESARAAAAAHGASYLSLPGAPETRQQEGQEDNGPTETGDAA